MRVNSGRTSVSFLMALCGAALAIECAGYTPTSGTPVTTRATAASPTAVSVRPMGTVEFLDCTPDGGCKYQGRVLNAGGCVKNVHGVTRLFDASGNELEARPWSINGRMRPKEEASFSGCCFSTKAVNAQRTSRTEVFAEELECI